MNNIITSYRDMWTRAFDFKGRSTVSEYWWPFLINMLITLCFIYVIPYASIALLYQVIAAIPCISLAIRRMHDSNRSGWNILWLYIPTIILLVYAGAILYYTQSPEIVDTFLKFFMAMVVSYVIFLVYSIYLLTHHTYPKKNHYGEVPHTHVEKTEEDEVLLEAPANADIEGTLTFKTKAFLEKAMRVKKKDENKDTQPLSSDKDVEEETAIEKAELASKDEKKKDVEFNTTEIETVEPAKIKEVHQETPNEKKKVIKKPKKELFEKAEVPAPVIENVPDSSNLPADKEEIVVMAQLKPSKKRPVKVKPKEVDKDTKEQVKVVKEAPKPIEKAETSRVKTVAEKRAELQQTMSLSKAVLMEEIRKTEEEAKPKKTESVKTVRRPVKRKIIQPVEVPNVNVEPIRTHSLDSIAKLVEQNMNKDPNEAPTITATMKRKPVKRKKKEE